MYIYEHLIIKITKSKEHGKTQIDKLNIMLEENILKDENFKLMKTFECDLENDIGLMIYITLAIYAGYVSADRKGAEVAVPRI